MHAIFKFYLKIADSWVFSLLIALLFLAFLFMALPIIFVVIVKIMFVVTGYYEDYLLWLGQFLPELKHTDCKDFVVCGD